ncbi:MAG: zinc-ribbon domain-containing protein [Oscillospiraceae bacterium]
MRCGYCGKKISETARFCPYCGKKNTGDGSEFAGKFDPEDDLLVIKAQEIFSEVQHVQRTSKYESAVFEKKRVRKAAVILFAAAICAAICFSANLIVPAIRYSNAEKLYEEGDSAGAEKIFSELGDYKSSADYVRKCRYETALALMDEELYPEAADAFTSLDGYADSNLLAAECMVKIADGYADEGDLRSAASVYAAAGKPELAKLAAKRRAEALAKSGDYFSAADVSQKYGNIDDAREYRYTGASEAQKNGDLKIAADNYSKLGDYKDSAGLAEKCAYEYFKSEYDKNGASEETARGFYSYFARNDPDSRELFPKIAYEYGMKCFEKKDFSTASDMFRNAGAYENAEEMLYKARYALGDSLIETDPASARSVFALLSTYSDSSEKKKAAAERLGSDESWYVDGYTSVNGYCTSIFCKDDVLLVSCTAGTDYISSPVTILLTFKDSAGNEVSADCEVRNSASFGVNFSLSSAAAGKAEIIISRKDNGSILRTIPIVISDRL